jgi:hypothetical protein
MQIHPALVEALITARERDARERALRAANQRAWRSANGDDPRDRASDAIAVRPARPADAAALSGLAQLDGGSRHADRLAALARDPASQTLLVAESNGSLVAALDLAADRTVAHPFRRSTAARELLELRARQLRPQPARRRRLRAVRGRLRVRPA